jgi:DNA replication protein DnaC
MYISLSCPTETDPDNKRNLRVAVLCKCEEEQEALERQRKQEAEEMEAIERLKKASLMDAKFDSATFSHFEKTKYNERNLKICLRYAEKFDEMVENNQGLLFWGGTGTGKSYAAACIANELIGKRVPVILTSFVRLLQIIESRREDEAGFIERINRAKLVIFDDLGAERGTDYALEKVYNIVDSRYRRSLPMILTTNLTMDEMKRETDIRYARIYDRIFETCYPMQFVGTSWRKREASRRYEDMSALLLGGGE